MDEPIEESLKFLEAAFRAVHNYAYEVYSKTVSALCDSPDVSEKEVEQALDGLLDFCGEERFRALYKDLCRCMLHTFPVLVQEHIQLYRAHTGEAENSELGGEHTNNGR